MSDVTCQDIFEKHIPERLAKKPELAGQNKSASYQFDLTGDGGGQWVVDLTQSPAQVKGGTMDSPGVTITMTAADFIALVNGKLNGQMAFMQGKLKIKGDMSLALKLQQILG
jgi:putative sterol carrier protein